MKQKGGVLKGKNRQTSKQKGGHRFKKKRKIKQKGGRIKLSYDNTAGFSVGYEKKKKRTKRTKQIGGTTVYDPDWNGGLPHFMRPSSTPIYIPKKQRK